MTTILAISLWITAGFGVVVVIGMLAYCAWMAGDSGDAE